MNFPIEYQVVEQVALQSNLLKTILSLRIGQRTLAQVPDGMLLVKMAMAPFNPSDIAFLQGSYNVKKPLPAVPGFEGAGRVVAVGEGVDHSWIGRKVACFAGNETDGTWAGYVLARPEQLLKVGENIGWEQAATILVNPFTAHAMFELALESGTPSIALNAAGSRVAEWMRALASLNGLKTINIVRKPETAQSLKARGVEHVLVSTDEDFAEKFVQLSAALECRMAFDAVGGNLGGQMLSAMPARSRLVVYGGLSNQPLGEVDVLGLIFRDKKVEGFDLNQWWASHSAEHKDKVAGIIQEMILNKTIDSKVSRMVELSDIVTGLRHYLGHMSEGKVLIRLQSAG